MQIQIHSHTQIKKKKKKFHRNNLSMKQYLPRIQYRTKKKKKKKKCQSFHENAQNGFFMYNKKMETLEVKKSFLGAENDTKQ